MKIQIIKWARVSMTSLYHNIQNLRHYIVSYHVSDIHDSSIHHVVTEVEFPKP